MSDDESINQALAFIEATASMADSMDAMKRALEDRQWSTPMAEQVGAQFGSAMFAMMVASNVPPRGAQ